MYIDTNRTESNYQDDNYEPVKSEYSRLKQELWDIRNDRFHCRKRHTWTWTLEVEFRAEQEHLQTMIQSESGVY